LIMKDDHKFCWNKATRFHFYLKDKKECLGFLVESIKK
jgi:hypothetical protein